MFKSLFLAPGFRGTVKSDLFDKSRTLGFFGGCPQKVNEARKTINRTLGVQPRESVAKASFHPLPDAKPLNWTSVLHPPKLVDETLPSKELNSKSSLWVFGGCPTKPPPVGIKLALEKEDNHISFNKTFVWIFGCCPAKAKSKPEARKFLCRKFANFGEQEFLDPTEKVKSVSWVFSGCPIDSWTESEYPLNISNKRESTVWIFKSCARKAMVDTDNGIKTVDVRKAFVKTFAPYHAKPVRSGSRGMIPNVRNIPVRHYTCPRNPCPGLEPPPKPTCKTIDPLQEEPPKCPIPANPCCPHFPETNSKKYKRLFLFIGVPIIVLQGLNAWQGDSHHKDTNCADYEFMRRRTKRFPWGDGQKSLFHNDHVNILPGECVHTSTSDKEDKDDEC